MQQLEHLASQVGRACAAGNADFNAAAAGGRGRRRRRRSRQGVQDGGDIWVKSKRLAETVEDGGVGGVWGRGEFAAVYMGVDPKGPERVVEVEDDEGWKGGAVG